MRTPAALLVLFTTGCAYSTVSAPPLHLALETEQLVAQGPPTSRGAPQDVTLAVAPVQLGTWIGPGELPSGAHAAVAVRVPERSVPTTRWFETPDVEPTLLSMQIWPHFNLHTIPLMPYGTFWIEVTNHTSAPISLDGRHLALEIGGRRMPALADRGEISGRWNLTLRALWHIRLSDPYIDPALLNVQVMLPRLDKPVQLQPGATWKGFVAFDIGNRYTADEYNQLLTEAGGATVELDAGSDAKASVVFKAEPKPFAAVCLPGTKVPSYVRCEVLAQHDAPVLSAETLAPRSTASAH